MLVTSNSLRKIFFLTFTVSLFVFFTSVGDSHSSTLFPHYKVINDNVVFWEKIYSQYSETTAVLHDKNRLDRIYATFTIRKRDSQQAKKHNRKLSKKVKHKYKTILLKFASGKLPQTKEERYVYNLFPKNGNYTQYIKAADNFRIQTGVKERFLEGVIRSGGYMGTMKQIFRSYGLPADLAYLPHVESSFNVEAYSKFGAAGVWQFTRSTGRDFMTVNYLVDERRDPIKSTHAAAKYLKQNYARLGSWPLALTAYNYGHAGMERAVTELGNYVNIFKNYRKGRFKFASRNFYSEFLAALKVAKRYEAALAHKLDKPKATLLFPLSGYVHIHDVIKHFNITERSLKKLNPALRPPIWRGEKYIPMGYQIRLNRTNANLTLAATFPRKYLRKRQKPSYFYTVKKGDTAGTIARKHNISLSRLAKANKLNSRKMVYIGQTLRIPSTHSTGTLGNRVQNTSPRKKTVMKIPIFHKGKKTLPPHHYSTSLKKSQQTRLSVRPLPSRKGVQYGEITVQPEESLGLYINWMKTTKREIEKLNGLKKNSVLSPGQTIILSFSSISYTFFEQKRREYHLGTEEDFFNSFRITGFTKYTVASGDTLWDICQKKFEMPLWLLKRFNQDLQYNALRHSQDLTIPIIEAL